MKRSATARSFVLCALAAFAAAAGLATWLVREPNSAILGSRPAVWTSPLPPGLSAVPTGGVRAAVASTAGPLAKETLEPRLLLAVVPAARHTAAAFALRAQIRCTDVQGKGYLEMWTHYVRGTKRGGEPEQYFSRTLGDPSTPGPTQALSGTQPWREIWLPFDATGATERPDRFELNLCLPGGGTVELKELTITEFSTRRALWDTLAGHSLSKGAGSSGLRATLWVLVALCSVAGTALAAAALRRRRAEAELRRMSAMDAA